MRFAQPAALAMLLGASVAGCAATHSTEADVGTERDATLPDAPDAPTEPDGGRDEPPAGVVVCGGTICATGEVCCVLTLACVARTDWTCAVPPDVTDPDACVRAPDCDEGEVCDHAADAPASLCGGVGRCVPARPSTECAATDVCGCDGRTYDDACAASRAGVRVVHHVACGAEIDGETPSVCGPGGGDCGFPFHHSRCDATIGRCVREDPRIACGIDAQCPTGQACCSITGECFDPTRPGACAVPPPGTYLPCEDALECARHSGAWWESAGPSGFCDAPTCEGPGGCRAVSSACDGVLAPVCGCDGVTYLNECEAHRLGVRVASPGSC